MTKTQYQQMIGRAGRTGFESIGDSVMMVQPNDLSQVTEEILLPQTNDVFSQLLEENFYGLQYLILNIFHFIPMGNNKNLNTLTETIVYSTLLGQQVSVIINKLFFYTCWGNVVREI